MALQKTITVPQTGATSSSYQWISLFQLRFDNQTFRMDTLDYASKAAYEANSVPIGGTSFVLPKEGLPALDDQQRRLVKRADNTYVLESEKDNPDATPVMPTYPEVPPMMTFLLSITAPAGGLPEGTPVFGYLMTCFYNFLVSRPEYVDCTVVDI